MTDEAVFLLVRLSCSFFAAFTALAVLSQTRNSAWVLLVLATVLFFIETLYAILVFIGITSYEIPSLPGIPLLRSLLSALPLLLLSLAFLRYLLQNRPSKKNRGK